MKILEIQMKNFGRFSDKTIRFHEGINILYGKNEAGKSTIHAFLRAMLFGMEKARGRAAKSDEYSRREPWENPGYFAGVLRFESGGKVFRLERNFNRREKSASLVCETDGEELSVENGDLDVLLEGLNETSYRNTFFVGQQGAATEEGLARELHNYMSNLENSGDAEIDVKKALSGLETKRRQVEAEKKKVQAAAEAQVREMQAKFAYVQQETERLAKEEAEGMEKLRRAEAEHLQAVRMAEEYTGEKRWTEPHQKAEAYKRGERRTGQYPDAEQKKERNRQPDERTGEGRQTGENSSQSCRKKSGRKTQAFPQAEILAALAVGILGVLGCVLLPWVWARYAAGVVCACALLGLLKIFVSSREEGEAWESTERDRLPSEKNRAESPSFGAAERERLRQLSGQVEKQKGHLEHIRSELREKLTLGENLRESVNELQEEKEDVMRLNQEISALRLAAQIVEEASGEVYSQWEGRLNRRVSEILSDMTCGRYTSIFLDANLRIRINTPDKLLGVWQVSRGTMEQIYFALRMAAGEILTGGEEVPVILDETFAMYDDERLEQTLRWLEKNKEQVILFTCQEREKRILENL